MPAAYAANHGMVTRDGFAIIDNKAKILEDFEAFAATDAYLSIKANKRTFLWFWKLEWP
jgi:hypothetical protein